MLALTFEMLAILLKDLSIMLEDFDILSEVVGGGCFVSVVSNKSLCRLAEESVSMAGKEVSGPRERVPSKIGARASLGRLGFQVAR